MEEGCLCQTARAPDAVLHSERVSLVLEPLVEEDPSKTWVEHATYLLLLVWRERFCGDEREEASNQVHETL